MQEVLLSLLLGCVTGFLFSFFNLPVPAPPTLAGLMGIVGLFVGYLLGKVLKAKV